MRMRIVLLLPVLALAAVLVTLFSPARAAGSMGGMVVLVRAGS